jgi:replicative DNA helicase
MSNIAAEKVFLAGVIANPTKLFDYLDYLDENDFQHAATKMTFEAVRSLILNKEATSLTKAKLVAEARALGHQNYLSATKDGKWIDELYEEKVEEQELTELFLEIKRQTLKENYKRAFEETSNYLTTTSDPLSVMIGRVEDSIISQVNSLDRGENAPVLLTKGIFEFIDDLANDPGNLGIDLGYPVWQDRIGQFRNGSVTLVVATAKAGKSQFALRAALNTARKGLPVILCDSELNKNDQQIRLVAMMARVPFQYIETGFWKMTPEQLKTHGVTDEQQISHIMECGRRLRDPELRQRVLALPITYQSISGMDVPAVIPHLRRWILKDVKPDRTTKNAQCLVVYDYIKLATITDLKANRNIAEWQMHGINVALLHDTMKRYNIPCLAFGQTNNEVDEGIQCVAGGKRISENVTSVSYLKKKTDDERAFDGNGSHLVRVFATRYGAGTPIGHINFDADLSCGDFKEIGLSTVNFNEERQKRLDEYKKGRDAKRKNDDDEDD